MLLQIHQSPHSVLGEKFEYASEQRQGSNKRDGQADPEQQPVSEGHTCICGVTRRIAGRQQRALPAYPLQRRHIDLRHDHGAGLEHHDRCLLLSSGHGAGP